MHILVIAPHPDDEVLGCGGTIAKHVKNGDSVYLCIVTKAYTPDWSEDFLITRKNEIKNATKILGIKKTYFLNFKTVQLDTIPQKDINESISGVINDVLPDIVYIPHKGDLNKDHRLIFESSLVSMRPIKHKIKKILSYEILSETDWGMPIEPFIPTVYINVSQFIDQKINAMKEYKSEIKKEPHPRSLKIIKSLAIKRGSECGVDYAEAFILIREFLE